MAFADSSARTVVAGLAFDDLITLAEACSEGDLLAYDSGWYLADGADATRPAMAIAGRDGAVGDQIPAYSEAVVTGFTGGTTGSWLYRSDTAGSYDDSAGTISQAVGLLSSATTATIKPYPQGLLGGADIADESIDSDHYVDGSIDLAHMSANSVDSDQYVDGSIDLAHMSANSVDSDQYVDGSIDAEHLSTSLKTGTINLDITTAREIASNDIQNLAAHGGLLASDSVPALVRANGATDKALRLDWANTEVDEIQFGPIAKPVDLDASADITVHIMAKMAGSTDTATTIDCQFYDGEGDTEAGASTTPAFTSSVTEAIATIPAAGIAAAPGFMNFGLVPSAHDTDDLYVYAVWIEYTRA